MNSLIELYRQHAGKVSDKWMLYLTEYDRLLSGYREQQISLLEIGVQNGGSLEVWGKYFPQARHFIGCDINQDCSVLSYDDPRISLILSDANSDAAELQIASIAPLFDVIIDDGSHTSADIVRSFARYFERLKEGGLFIVEDLHCSYWQEFQGGLYYPYSSQAFFKKLADIVNHEFWGIEKSRVSFLDGFAAEFGCRFEESVLAKVHSVEFINSMCVIRKYAPEMNVLGGRFIAGTKEQVVPGHLELKGVHLVGPSQTGNTWSALEKAPEEMWAPLRTELARVQEQVTSLQAQQMEMVKRSDADASFIQQLRSRVELLDAELNEWSAKAATQQQRVSEILGSRSWKITAPLRMLAGLLRRKP
ncbi:class I SAM-dependent methyltransferase [Silvimonas sp.]|uniref:class I SAM-dependent methyltransferase n=1 Tax=Silvimonas sp. TaxID=2650811 RepID=UPI00283CE88C|nr:class I SAM-dependent methyltransferase [Silvimonas sp.]MDR3429437.1 hypothetical protein [Silvimonas sp.]